MPGTVVGRKFTVGNRSCLCSRGASLPEERHSQMQIAVPPGQELHTHNRRMSKALWMMTSRKGKLHIHAAFYLGFEDQVRFQLSQNRQAVVGQLNKGNWVSKGPEGWICMLGACEYHVQLEGSTYDLGGITEPELRLARQVEAVENGLVAH